MNCGLDFGTTNSILSFYEKNRDYVETYKLDGASGANYIPSVLAIDEDDEVYIGSTAKGMIGNKYADTFSYFKVLLNEDKKEELEKNGYSSKTPKEITSLYLRTLIEKFKENYNTKIEKLVLTVPEIWIKDDYISRSALQEVKESLDIKNIEFVSEPVSAGSYFLYHFEKEKKAKFNGHLLVFDYGGGTLDVTLLQSQNNQIKVLERAGIGKDKKLKGRAGVAFDEMVINSICNKDKDEIGQNSLSKLLLDFEKEKISSSPRHQKLLDRYIKDNKQNRPIFELNCNDKNNRLLRSEEIFTSNLYHSFEPLKEDINRVLREIEEQFSTHNVNIEDSQSFRVLMVGGFSNFYLSQKSVEEFFNASFKDERFNSYFQGDDATLSISKGASLIAQNIIKIDETHPLTLDLLFFKKNRDGTIGDKEQEKRIFTKGDIVKNHKVQMQKGKIAKAGNIKFSIKGLGVEKIIIKIDKNKEELFPNYNIENNKWQIGFSIDKSSFLYVHIKDETGEEKKTELGYILQYKDAIIMED